MSSKALELADRADKKGDAVKKMAFKLLGEAAVTIAQQLRGSLCAFCGDPEVDNAIYKVAGSWVVNQAGYDDYIGKIKSAYNSTRGAGKDCLDNMNYNKEKNDKLAGVCPDAAQAIENYKTKLAPCADETECQEKAKKCFNPLGTTCVDDLSTAQPTDTSSNVTVTTGTRRRVVRADKATPAPVFHRVLAPTYTTSATGGAKPIVNADEDNSLSIGG